MDITTDSTGYDAVDKPIEALSYQDLIQVIIDERKWDAQSSSHRAFQSRIKVWCNYVGSSLESLAFETLAGDVTARINALLESRENPDDLKTDYNTRWAVSELKRVYESLRTSTHLPADFREAITLAMATAGVSVSQVIARLRLKFPDSNYRDVQIKEYLNGKKAPYGRHANSRQLVTRLESVLDLKPGVLASRAFKNDKLVVEGNPDTIAYRTHQSLRTKSRYSLAQMPAQLEATWNEIVYWRSQMTCRVRGELYVVAKGAYWTRPRSSLKYKNNLLRYMGWLCLPAPTKPLHELTEEERWQCGKGMDEKDITLAHWMNLDLVWDFTEFLRARQHNKAFTQDHLHFMIFLNSLVNHPYSFFKAHDKLASIYGQSLTGVDWVAYVETKMHLPLLKMCSQIKKVIEFNVKQRSPDEPLRAVFADEDPMLLLLQMVSRMEADVPPPAQQKMRAVYLRDIALFRMELEVPLRVGNLAMLKLNKDVRRDEVTSLWTVLVPKGVLKNHQSPHAYNIDRTYSVATSKAIDRYINEGRQHLYGADGTDWLFLGQRTGPPRKDVPGKCKFQVNEAALYWIVRSRTQQYFGGNGVGTNLFRHLLATSVLKDDSSQVETASAILNNSPDTIRRNYKHLTQNDGLRLADAWRAKQDKKYKERFGGRQP